MDQGETQRHGEGREKDHDTGELTQGRGILVTFGFEN